jgi:hypothetical protein
LNQIYVAGTTTSWDFPWQDNLQPFNGDSDAFVALLDPTSPAGASLIYSTPLGGTAPVGLTAGSQGNAVAVDASGNAYIAGATSTADFPRTATDFSFCAPVASYPYPRMTHSWWELRRARRRTRASRSMPRT